MTSMKTLHCVVVFTCFSGITPFYVEYGPVSKFHDILYNNTWRKIGRYEYAMFYLIPHEYYRQAFANTLKQLFSVNEAQIECEFYGGELGMPKNQEIDDLFKDWRQEMILAYFGICQNSPLLVNTILCAENILQIAYTLFIGLKRVPPTDSTIKEEYSVWNDGTPVTYTNWQGGVNSRDCVVYRNRAWDDASCTGDTDYIPEPVGDYAGFPIQKLGFFCQKEIRRTTTTTTRATTTTTIKATTTATITTKPHGMTTTTIRDKVPTETSIISSTRKTTRRRPESTIIETEKTVTQQDNENAVIPVFIIIAIAAPLFAICWRCWKIQQLTERNRLREINRLQQLKKEEEKMYHESRNYP